MSLDHMIAKVAPPVAVLIGFLATVTVFAVYMQ